MFPAQVAAIERTGTDPRASTLAKLAAALDVPVCFFFDAPKGGRHGHKKGSRTV